MFSKKPKKNPSILEVKDIGNISKHVMGPFLDTKTLSALSLTSKGVSTLFQESFEDLAHRELLQAIVDGNQEKLNKMKKMLTTKPELLLKTPKKGLVIESKLTWQKFYAEELLKMAVKRDQLEMAQWILDNIKDKDDKEEAIKQWDACTVSEKVKKERETQYADKMKKLIVEIAKETFPKGTEKDRLIDRISDETKNILEIFRKELLPDTPIKLDNYFDLEALLYAAYQAYDNNFNDFQNRHQRDLYCTAIIGFIQSVVSPELAKIFCEGLYAVVEQKKPLSKGACSFKLTKEKDVAIYRARPSVVSGIGAGFDFFVSIFADCRGGDVWKLGWIGGPAFYLKNYVEQKYLSLASLKKNLMRDIRRSSCVIL